MKNIIILILVAFTFILAGCGHSGNFTASGKVVTIGTPECGLTYVNGLMSVTGSRENTESVVEFSDDDGISGAPTADMKSVRTIRYKTGVQLNGYAVDLAKKCPDAIIEYVKIMPQLNTSSQWDTKENLPKKEAGTKTATDGYIEVLKEKLKSIAGKDGKETKSVINGDGEYKELWKDNSITAQASLTAELLAIADDTTLMPSEGETIKDSLVHYAGRLAQLKAKGKSESTRILLDRCTVKDGKLAYLMYRYTDEEGKVEDAECPSCYTLED